MGNVISINKRIISKLASENLDKYSQWLSDTAEAYPGMMWGVVKKAFDYYRNNVPSIWQAHLSLLAGNADHEGVVQFYSTICSKGVPYHDACEFMKVVWIDQSVPTIRNPGEREEEFRNLSAKYATDYGELIWNHIALWFSVLEIMYTEGWTCISCAEMEDGLYHHLFGHPSGRGMVHVTLNPTVPVNDNEALTTAVSGLKEKQ